MAKRFAGAALICALLCVFAGAALSQGATAAAPAPTPENVPAVVDPLAQTPGTANTDAVTNVVITLSTGEWDAKDARKQAALYLLKPLLAGFTGTGATAGLYVMDDKPLILAQNVPLQTETDLNDLYAKLDGLNKVRFPEYASAFDALCSTLYANCVPATADPAEKLSGNTELWMVDLRDPLYFSPEERSNNGGTKADQFSQAMDSLSALMDAMPGLTLHYVYVTGANGLPADGDIADRMDTLLVNRLGNTGRIQIHVLYANDTAQAFDG
ncbi:MAG: hypothetical protein LLF96_07565, partial [Eubacteriales bacterium]|nr:hypothetical protein [Eubacteriales bacterium]